MPKHAENPSAEHVLRPFHKGLKPLVPHLRVAKVWYVRLAVGLLNTIVLLVLTNLVLGGFFSVFQPPEFDLDVRLPVYPGYTRDELEELLDETWHRPFSCEPFTQFRESPFEGKYVNVDPAGFRWIADQGPWPPDTDAYNVFVFGGSTTFGYGVADDETIASYLQEALREEGREVNVYNFGRGYYYSSRELVLFENLLREGFVPDAAVFVDGLNEFYYYVDDGTDYARACGSWGRTALATSEFELPLVRAARLLRRRLGELMFRTVGDPTGFVPVPGDTTVTEDVVNRWFANKRLIESVAGGYDVDVLFVWQPVPTYKYDLAYHPFVGNDPDGFGQHLLSRYGYEVMADFSQSEAGHDENVLYLDTIQEERKERLYVDRVHYSAAFSEEIARAIAAEMIRIFGNETSLHNSEAS
jgi:hypothetical protein